MRNPATKLPGLFASFVASLIICSTTLGQAPGSTLLDQVKQAYQNVQQYDCKVIFKTEQKLGRWTNTQQTWLRTVFDRPGSRVMIDKPEFILVVVDDSIRLTSDQLAGRFLDAARPEKLTLTALITEVNMLAKPILIDMAFLLEDDPIDLLTSGGTSLATPLGVDPQDPQKRPRLQVGTAEGELTMYFDPKTLLLDQAIFDLNFQGTGPGDYARLVYDYEYAEQVEITDELFELKTDGLVAADNFQQMVSMQGLASGPSAQGTGSAMQQQEVRKAPPIKGVWVSDKQAELVRFDLKEVEEPIIVLHFWATWLPTAYKSIPAIESLRNWVDENKLPVQVLTVNAGDQLQEVQRFMRVEERDVPVVLDRDYKISESYGANTLPLTVFIVEGEIVEVLNGYADNMDELVKSELNKYVTQLKEKKEKKEAKALENASEELEAATDAQP